MYVLLDFDGVITREEAHAELHREAIIDELSKLTGFERSKVIKDFNSAKEMVLKNPHQHGWTINENTCGFAEDLFILTNAAACLMALKNAAYGDAVKKKYNFDMGMFCPYIFDKVTRNAPSGLKPEIKEQIEELKRKANVIIISNSESEKIKRILDAEKIELPIIGNAKKYIVDNSFDKVPEFLRIKDFKISLRRPFYFEKLNEFKEAIVVGDVFSLDLALPLYLKHKIVLMQNNYTPKWSKRYCKRHGYVVTNLFELSEQLSK